ncbi:hypothetical protein [Piscibacillus salipiscarius]|uniref:hypothetical protein n=1 Tax=Piscibacillus salipiscarius TaxID=299480 RepID=UPI0006D17FC2|nr:hypothetical protein [Piscibacillus salipiscarius]
MKVLPENLVPGCLLLKDVQGKTIHPIVPKNTVVEPIHIKVLKDFEVPYVEVASRLVNGDTFQAPEVDPNTIKQEQNHSKMQKEPKEYTFLIIMFMPLNKQSICLKTGRNIRSLT